MNCVLYARVSTGKQALKELSLPAQLQLMREHAAQQNWAVLDEYVEPGETGTDTDRPALQRLLARIRTGRSGINVVLVHKIDRLARYVLHHSSMTALFREHGVRLASVSEKLDDSASGHFMENVLASVAQFYSENLADEVKKGMRQKVLKGGWPHLPPRGYILVGRDGQRGSVVAPHPTEGALVRGAFERYATGHYSLKQLAASLHRDGLTARNKRPLSAAQVQRILTNRFYVAQVIWKDLQVKGEHEALVSTSLFERVQRVMDGRADAKGAKGEVNGFPLRGLAICASCRGHMTASRAKRRWGYYHCSRRGYDKGSCNARGYCGAQLAHAQVDRICLSLRLTKEVADALMEAAKQLISERTKEARQRLAVLQSERRNLAAQELRLTKAFASAEIPAEAYKTAAGDLRDRLSRTDSALESLTADPAERLRRVGARVERAASIRDLGEELSETKRVQLLRTVFRTIVLDEHGVAGFDLQTPFDVLFTNGLPMASFAEVSPGVQQTVANEVLDRLDAFDTGLGTTS